MSNATRHIRHGVGSVRPYLYGRLDMLELVKRAFGAVELEHLPVGNGAHVEAKIGDSMLVMEVSDPPHPGGKPASIYVYVDDVETRPTIARWRQAQPRYRSPKTSPTRNAPPA
ncbi:VOC family protein [Candidatus Binatus sp.]|uniref:VOC family protein n=1 Tax=Candidatus Binatus sp. TaxID=2811406 RepID=UPI003C328A6D